MLTAEASSIPFPPIPLQEILTGPKQKTTGSAIEQFKAYAPEVLDSFKALAATGCVEFLAETYSHSLSSLYSVDEFKHEVKLHTAMIKEEFGVKPTAFRNTELIYSDNIAKAVEGMGFKTMLVWIYWLIPVNVAVSHDKTIEQITFLVCILLTVFTMDLIKCAIAYELKRFMTDKVITIMNRVVGSILILFGVYLIVSAFTVIDIPTMSSVVG